MKTKEEIIKEIESLLIEIDNIKTRHHELHSIEDSDEWEKSLLKISTKKSRLEALKWVLSL